MRIVRERRQRRSDNTSLALHYQLESSRQAAELDGMFLSDEDGVCLATSGDPDACEEVAARLPFIGRRVPEFEGVLLGQTSGWRIRMERVRVLGADLYLCAIGQGAERQQQLARTHFGVRRILQPDLAPQGL